jgi:excisionase family DNA binding protein
VTDERPPAREQRPPPSESDWLRPGQAAALLGVAQSTVRAWTEQGRLPVFYTDGGHRRYRRRDVERVRDERQTPADNAGGTS